MLAGSCTYAPMQICISDTPTSIMRAWAGAWQDRASLEAHAVLVEKVEVILAEHGHSGASLYWYKCGMDRCRRGGSRASRALGAMRRLLLLLLRDRSRRRRDAQRGGQHRAREHARTIETAQHEEGSASGCARGPAATRRMRVSPPATPAQYLREIAVSCRQYCANPAYSADYPRYFKVP